jgi:hypothetical protein
VHQLVKKSLKISSKMRGTNVKKKQIFLFKNNIHLYKNAECFNPYGEHQARLNNKAGRVT